MSNVLIGFLSVVAVMVLVYAFPSIFVPALLIFGFVIVIKISKQKNTAQPHTREATSISRSENTATSFSTNFHTKSNYTNYSRFFQKWDDSYNKELGYEWFRVCVERKKFPIYNSISVRLRNLRKANGLTQVEAAKCLNVSASTLSSYENGYTTPSKINYVSLANCYCVPLQFIQYGFVDNLSKHMELCERYGEEEYMHSLLLSITAASRLFPEMLTPNDKDIVIFVNTALDMKLDLFNEQAIAKEKIRNTIKADIIRKLSESEIIQRDLYLVYEDNRSIAQSVVKELYEDGTILKEKQGNTYILQLSNHLTVDEKLKEISQPKPIHDVKSTLVSNDQTIIPSYNESWEQWCDVHGSLEQMKRIRRASTKEFMCRHVDVDSGEANFLGSNGDTYYTNLSSCTCPDFQKRGLPCKHMYYLASNMHLFYFENYLK